MSREPISALSARGTRATALHTIMWDLLSWLFFLVFIAALAVVAGLLLRGYLATGSVAGLTNTFFAPKADKRLEVVDYASVDGRRRLVLIRRDEVEHLIMTGGPVDVVIETGIGQKRQRPVSDVTDSAQAAVFNRPARTFGQAVGDK